MSFDLKKLKGLFVESTNEPATAAPTVQASQTTETKPSSVTSNTPVSSELDQQIVESLLKAIEQNNLRRRLS
jgi:hypothetical protein